MLVIDVEKNVLKNNTLKFANYLSLEIVEQHNVGGITTKTFESLEIVDIDGSAGPLLFPGSCW